MTPINRAWIDDSEKRAMVESHIPMGRAGTAKAMAEVMVFLCFCNKSTTTDTILRLIKTLKEHPMTFLVESHFTTIPNADILALIPAESARGAELDAEGVRLHLFIAADQSKAWQIYRTDSLAELQRILASFPLHQYVTTTITALAN